MDDSVDLTAEDFPDVVGARGPNDREMQFELDFRELIIKYGIKAYVCGVELSEKSATIMIDAHDNFIHLHREICKKAIRAPGKPRKIN